MGGIGSVHIGDAWPVKLNPNSNIFYLANDEQDPNQYNINKNPIHTTNSLCDMWASRAYL